jgi:hypothetical protein
MEFIEAQQALCTELNTDFSDVSAGSNTLFTLAEIQAFILAAAQRAWDYKPWTFTEGSVTLTTPAPTSTGFAYPATFEDESIFLVQVNNVPWIGPNNGKRNFAEYLKWLSDYPSDNSLIWSEYARQYYLNRNAYSAGQTYTLYGKLRAPALSGDSDLMPFSPTSDTEENSGNKAIVLLAFSDALASQKKNDPAGAAAQEKRAILMLDTVWKPMGERKAEKNAQNTPFFNSSDLFSNNRGRGGTNISNFP